MKAFAHLILVIAILAGLGWTLYEGLSHRHEKESEPASEDSAQATKEAEPEEPDKNEPSVKLTDDQVQSLDLKTAVPVPASLKLQRLAFGRVLDPTPLLNLDSELATAEAALQASKAENDRTQALLVGGQNVSQKIAETSAAQYHADQIKLDGIRRSAVLTWGAWITDLDPRARTALVDSILRGETSFVRADVSSGESLTETPLSARVLISGREETPLITSTVIPSQDTDPNTQAQGFLLRLSDAPFPLRAGMALTAYLEMPGEPRQGVVLPRSSILRHEGQTWIYVTVLESKSSPPATDEHKFARLPVTLDTPQTEGWFVAGAWKEGQVIVIEGGASLLSQELKTAGGLEEE